jgi:hypothetical protein
LILIKRAAIQLISSRLLDHKSRAKRPRLFASNRTIEAAERVMDRIIETYYSPKIDTQARPDLDRKSDVLREFAECCRAELRA